LLSSFPLSIELQGIDHALIPIVHHKSSPFFGLRNLGELWYRKYDRDRVEKNQRGLNLPRSGLLEQPA
jgi:hypothetical protein